MHITPWVERKEKKNSEKKTAWHKLSVCWPDLCKRLYAGKHKYLFNMVLVPAAAEGERGGAMGGLVPPIIIRVLLKKPLRSGAKKLLRTLRGALSSLVADTPSTGIWHRCADRLIACQSELKLLKEAESKRNHDPLIWCCTKPGVPAPHWKITHSADLLHLTTRSNFRMRQMPWSGEWCCQVQGYMETVVPLGILCVNSAIPERKIRCTF